MKTVKEIMKTLLVFVIYAAFAIDFILLGGESEDLSIYAFITIKAASLVSFYALYKVGKYGYHHGFAPEWYITMTEKLLTEED